MRIKQRRHNRRLAKKRVQCLNEALCFVSSFVLADSFVLRIPLLRQAPNRCVSFEKNRNIKKMLDNFFKLNGEPKEIGKPSEFKSIVSGEESEIRDILYRPDVLKNNKKHPRYKISRKTFINVSFTKTKLKNIDFTLCHFEDCLFIGTEIENCQFHQCTFKNVNTHQIELNKPI